MNITSHNFPKNTSSIFTTFAVFYTLFYCLIPYFFSITIWPDSAQIFTWSQHFAWGYHEHPWVPPFIVNIFSTLTYHSPLGIFFVGAMLNVMAFWGVWRLGRQFLPENCALLAGLLLATYLLTSFFLGQVNNNSFNFGLWPIMYLCFYHAIVSQKLKYWIAAGVVAGIATLSKYFTALPLACLGLFLLMDKQARMSFTKPGIYCGIFIYILILFPHIIWLFQNNFAPIQYALDRSQSDNSLFYQIYWPILFTLSQLGSFSIPFLIILLLYLKFPRYTKIEWPVSQFNKRFLFFVGWGPFILTVILSLLLGWNLPNEWGQALPCLWSLCLMTAILPKLSQQQLNRQVRIIYSGMFILMALSLLFLTIQSRYKPSIALNFPADKIAQWISNEWNSRYDKPILYIISSDEYIGGVVSFYSSSHPKVYSNCSDCLNFIPKADLEKQGAIVILTDGFGGHFHLSKVTAKMKKSFPNLIILPVTHFKLKRAPSDPHFPQATVWAAILPPKTLKPPLL